MPHYAKFQGGFPLEFLTFCRNEYSLTVERFGGIDCIRLLDYETFGDKTYYERGRLDIFSRNAASSMGRVLYGPAIRFLTRVNGRDLVLRPVNGDHLPYGIRATQQEDGLDGSYSMRIGDHAAAFEFGCFSELREKFIVMVSKLHVADLDTEASKNQYACTNGEWGIHWLPAKYRDASFDPAKPFADDGMMHLKWQKFYFKDNALIMAGDLSFAYGSHPLYVVLKCDNPIQMEETGEQWKLFSDWNGKDRIRFAIAYGRSESEAMQYADDAITLYADRMAADDRENEIIQQLAPECNIADIPEAADFIRIVPLQQNALLLGENAKEAAIRASAHKFGYFALWDHIYPIRDFFMSGQLDKAKKLLTYLLDYPHIRTALWSTFQMILAINEYLAYHKDKEFLNQAWPVLRDWFEFACTLADPEYGLVKFSLNMGSDNPAELGGEDLFFASDINGWWYNACRVMENFAYEMQNTEIAEQAAELSAKMEKSYPEKFFNDEVGYLTVAVKGKNEIYHNSASEVVEYPYGRKLMRHGIKSMADYQANKLYHPLGHVAVSWDSAVKCEMWRDVRMNQHVGHECKLARFAGDSAEAKRIIKGYLNYYKRTLNAIETFNYFGCDADVHELSDWQAFSATAAQHGIFQGVCGLFWHRGGLCYTPAKDTGDISIKKFHIRDGQYEIQISGDGAYTSGIILNGASLNGTMQIPVDRHKKENVLKITRSATPYDKAVLLYALDLEIEDVTATDSALCFRSCNTCHTDMVFAIPPGAAICLTCNGKELEYELDPAQSQLLYSGMILAGDEIEITIK